MPFFSTGGREWIKARTGMNAVFPHGHISPILPIRSIDKRFISMPDRGTIDRHLISFKTSAFRQIFPLMDEDLFNMTIRMAYGHPDSPISLDTMSAKTCIYAFMAFTSSLFTHTREASNGEAYALEARKRLAELLHHPATIDGLQAVLFLVRDIPQLPGSAPKPRFLEIRESCRAANSSPDIIHPVHLWRSIFR